MLGIRKILAVTAVLTAVSFASSDRPAKAVVIFNLEAYCDICPFGISGPGFPDPGGILVTGRLKLDLTPGSFGNGTKLFQVTDDGKILEFSLTFDPNGANIGVDFNDPFTLNDDAEFASETSIRRIEFTDSLGKSFLYQGEEAITFSWSFAQGSEVAFGDAFPSPSFTLAEPVAEPGTMATFLLGSIGLLALARRRTRAGQCS